MKGQVALDHGAREERWRWLTERSSGGELVHDDRSQYSSTIDNARVKLRTEWNGNGQKRTSVRFRLNGMGRNGNGFF